MQFMQMQFEAFNRQCPALPTDPQVFGLQAVSVDVVLGDLNNISTAHGGELIHPLHMPTVHHIHSPEIVIGHES